MKHCQKRFTPGIWWISMVSCYICQNCTWPYCRPPSLTKTFKSLSPSTRVLNMSQFWKHSSIYTNIGLAYFMHLQRTLLYVAILRYATLFSWQRCTLQYRLYKLLLPPSLSPIFISLKFITSFSILMDNSYL
jgi:hypothetical protein